MDIHHYIGIALSKATLDWAVLDCRTLVFQMTTANTGVGIKNCFAAVGTLVFWNPGQAVFCPEHTGWLKKSTFDLFALLFGQRWFGHR